MEQISLVLLFMTGEAWLNFGVSFIVLDVSGVIFGLLSIVAFAHEEVRSTLVGY